jgi:tetrapyrrole methylase family protein / MazG family protein
MKSFEQLIRVMARLRGPGGCPWDRKQTHQTLLKYLFEESRELRTSIRRRDWRNMEEELGDVLLQVVFHSQLAKEKGRFTIDDVVRTLVRKLTLRHPHVFGYTSAHRKALKGRTLRSAREVLASWDTLKQISHRRKPVKER